MTRKPRVGIIGGAFDPITEGHIGMTKVLHPSFGILDEIWMMPCCTHRFGKGMTPFHHRLQMCYILSQETRKFAASGFEGMDFGSTYDMLVALKAQYKTLDFYFIVGNDNANCIQQWYRWQEVIAMIPFIVIERQGSPLTATWCRQSPHFIVNLNIPEISSTEARMLLRRGLTPPLMHPKVLEYIRQNGLYQ